MSVSETEVFTRDGLRLVCRLWPAPTPRGLVVMTHGYGEHCGRYERLGATLAAAGFALFAYDLRGHGHSQGRRGHAPSYAHFLDDLAQVVAHARAQIQAPHTFLFGHSMGGGIVLNYALTRPVDEIAGLIATAPWLRLAFQPPAWKVAAARLLAGVVPSFSLPTNLDARLLSRDTQVGVAYRNDALVHGTMSAASFVGAVAAGEYSLAHAAALRLPLLVMHGGGDGIIDVRASEAFAQGAGSADKTFTLWPGMYHEILNELDAQPVYAAMVDWLVKRV